MMTTIIIFVLAFVAGLFGGPGNSLRIGELVFHEE